MKRSLVWIIPLCLFLGCRHRTPRPEPVSLAADYDQASSAELQTYQSMREKLQQPVSCDFFELPLSSVASRLADSAEVEVHLDRHALDDESIEPEAKVTLSVENVRLLTALRLLRTSPALRGDLSFAIDGERILLTSHFRADEQLLRVVFYPGGDLLNPNSRVYAESESLMHAIETCIDPESWETRGGSGNVSFQNGGLVVTHSDDHQEQVAALLDVLHTAQSLSSRDYDPTPLGVGYDHVAQNKVRDALRTKRLEVISFRETPLIDVIGMLCDHCQVQFIIDQRGLLRDQIDPQTPITDSWTRGTAETILRDVLDSVELTYVFRDDLLEITTSEQLANELIAKVYPIRDLLAIEPESSLPTKPLPELLQREPWLSSDDDVNRQLLKYQSLIDVLLVNVDSKNWEEFGGAGAASPVIMADALVVTQLPSTHDKIERYLTALRRDGRPMPPKPPVEIVEGQGSYDPPSE